jgi:hypothetical protein
MRVGVFDGNGCSFGFAEVDAITGHDIFSDTNCKAVACGVAKCERLAERFIINVWDRVQFPLAFGLSSVICLCDCDDRPRQSNGDGSRDSELVNERVAVQVFLYIRFSVRVELAHVVTVNIAVAVRALDSLTRGRHCLSSARKPDAKRWERQCTPYKQPREVALGVSVVELFLISEQQFIAERVPFAVRLWLPFRERCLVSERIRVGLRVNKREHVAHRICERRLQRDTFCVGPFGEQRCLHIARAFCHRVAVTSAIAVECRLAVVDGISPTLLLRNCFNVLDRVKVSIVVRFCAPISNDERDAVLYRNPSCIRLICYFALKQRER